MTLLNYSLASLITYLGIFMGFALAIIAKEEIKPGKKYFIFMQKAILLLIFLFLLIYRKLNYIAASLVLASIMIYLLKTKKKFNKLPYIYTILAVIFFMSSKIINLFIIESSLIFLYGIPTGTLLTKRSKKETMTILLKGIPFILIAIILHLIF